MINDLIICSVIVNGGAGLVLNVHSLPGRSLSPECNIFYNAKVIKIFDICKQIIKKMTVGKTDSFLRTYQTFLAQGLGYGVRWSEKKNRIISPLIPNYFVNLQHQRTYLTIKLYDYGYTDKRTD